MKDKANAMKRTIVAVVVAGGLLLSAGGPALSAGKLGGASGIDEFRSAQPAVGGEAGGDLDRPVAQGGMTGGVRDRRPVGEEIPT